MGRILRYFGPSLSYHLLLRSLFCLFLSGRFACFTVVGMCIKRRFKSVWASIQSDHDQSLSFPPEETLNPWLPRVHIEESDQTALSL